MTRTNTGPSFPSTATWRGGTITYTGYLLLVIGLILCLVGKDSRFMRQSRRLKELRKATNVRVLLLALLAVPLSVNAGGKASPMLDAVQKYAVSPEHAALFGALPIQSGSGRMMPVNTFSSEILRKLHKSDKIGQLNSDQFLLSLLAHARYVDARSLYLPVQSGVGRLL